MIAGLGRSLLLFSLFASTAGALISFVAGRRGSVAGRSEGLVSPSSACISVSRLPTARRRIACPACVPGGERTGKRDLDFA